MSHSYRPLAVSIALVLGAGCAVIPEDGTGAIAPITVGPLVFTLDALMAYPVVEAETRSYEALHAGHTELGAWFDVEGTADPLDEVLEGVDLSFEIENDETGEVTVLAGGAPGLRAVRWAVEGAALPGIGAATGRIVAERTSERLTLGRTPRGYLYLVYPAQPTNQNNNPACEPACIDT